MSTSTTAPRPATRRPSAATRRSGYVVAVVVNAALLWLVNVWPGWAAVPFLTAATTQVLALLNASFVLAIVLNVAYLVRDPAWLTTLGSLATAGLGVAVCARLLVVFPFDLPGAWPAVARALLVVGMVGTAIACLVYLVSLIRLLAGSGTAHRAGQRAGHGPGDGPGDGSGSR